MPTDGIPAWILGALICLFGSTLTALGLVLQKLSHTVHGPAKGVAHREAAQLYFLQGWWQLGFGIYMSAQVINVVSMAMTPQVVLSCLGSWTLVCNTAFAHLLLGERVGRRQTLAVAALVTSTALVLVNAPRPTPKEEASDRDIGVLLERFISPDFDALTVLLVGFAVAARSLTACWSAAAVAASGCPGGEAAAGAPGGCAGGAGAASPAGGEKLRLALPAAWVLMAAVAGGYTALLFKCIAEIAAGAAEASPPPWRCWETYALLLAALSCAPIELHCLNVALQCGDAVSVVPMYLALSMLAQLTTGAVFFQEFRDFQSAADAAAFLASVAFTLFSVVAMARAKARPAAELGKHGKASGTFTLAPEADVLVPSVQENLEERLLSAEVLEYLEQLEKGGSPGSKLLVRRGVSIAGFGGAIEAVDAFHASSLVARSASALQGPTAFSVLPAGTWSLRPGSAHL